MKSDPVEAVIEAMEKPKSNTPMIDAAPDVFAAAKIALEAIYEEKRLQASRGESVSIQLLFAQQSLDKALTKAGVL